MLYLILAIVSSTVISVFLRRSENHIKNNMTMFVWNYAACTLLAIYFKGNLSLSINQKGMGFAFILGVAAGILYLVNFVIFQLNIQKNGVVLSGTFMKLGVIVPILMALLLFREKPEMLQIVGCILAVLAIVLIQFEKEAKGQGQYKSFLILLLLVSGFTDSLSNIFEKLGNPLWKDEYLLFTFFSALLAAAVMKWRKKQGTVGADILFGLLIGIPNYFSARFLLLALGSLPAIIVYPVYSVGTIVCITLSGMVLFSETLTKQKLVAMGMILVALFCINL